MWKSLVKSKNEPAYYIKVEENNNNKIKKTSASLNRLSYRISVTNYVKLWSGEFDNDGIIKIMLESNKDIEASDGQGFLKAAFRMLNNPKIIEKIEFNALNTGHLSVKMLSLGTIVIKMDFSLSVCCAEQFFDSVTRPLLLIIDDQNKSETELRKLVEGISEYLSKIPKELLMRYEKKEINHYNDKIHMQKHNVMEDIFGKDEEERIDPRHILYGRPLPALPYDMPLPIKEEGNLTAACTLLPIEAIKTELTDEKPGSSVSNFGKSVSNLETNVSNLDTNVSSVGTSVSNANNHPPTVNTNNASDAHLKQELIKKEEPDSTGQENNENVQIVQSTTRRSLTETQSSQIPRNNTPKKRRKNLNY